MAIDKSKRNKNAGKTPSYDKRNMSKKARANKKKKDKEKTGEKEESEIGFHNDLHTDSRSE